MPQLRTITLGGAVTGLGIESTSLRNGLPHESVLEMDVLTGSGEVVTTDAGSRTPTCSAASPTPTARSATPPGCASSSSRSTASVALRHVRFHDLDDLVAALGAVVADGEFDGEAVDYVDGVVFSATESYLVLGRRDRRAGADQRLHRPRHLLPVDPARRPGPTARPAHHPRLPVALGHRLVLVLAGRSGPRTRAVRAALAASAGCAAASTGS